MQENLFTNKVKYSKKDIITFSSNFQLLITNILKEEDPLLLYLLSRNILIHTKARISYIETDNKNIFSFIIADSSNNRGKRSNKKLSININNSINESNYSTSKLSTRKKKLVKLLATDAIFEFKEQHNKHTKQHPNNAPSMNTDFDFDQDWRTLYTQNSALQNLSALECINGSEPFDVYSQHSIESPFQIGRGHV